MRNTIVTKTAHMVRNIKSDKINFLFVANLALAQVNQYNISEGSCENLHLSTELTLINDFLGYSTKTANSIRTNLNRLLDSHYKDSDITIKDDTDGSEKHQIFTGREVSVKYNKVTLNVNGDLSDYVYVKYKNKDEDKINYNQFIVYDINWFKDCTSCSTLLIYEFIKMHAYKDTVFVRMSELKQHLDVKERKVNGKNKTQILKNGSYLDYNMFNRKILKPAIEYINKHTDLTVTVRKEKKTKQKYQLNGEEKSYIGVDTLVFEIEHKVDVKFASSYLIELAMEEKVDVTTFEKGFVKAQEWLKENDVNVEVPQLITLYRLCKDLPLVKMVLVEAGHKKDIVNLGGYAYKVIKRLVDEKAIDAYKNGIYDKHGIESPVKAKAKLESYVLDEDDMENLGLVKIYNKYHSFKGYVSENDVVEMKYTMVEHKRYKIEVAIEGTFNTKKHKNKCNGFKYIRTLLNKGVFDNADNANTIVKPEAKPNNQTDYGYKNSSLSRTEKLDNIEEASKNAKDGDVFDFDILRG